MTDCPQQAHVRQTESPRVNLLSPEIVQSILAVTVPAAIGLFGYAIRYSYELGYCAHFNVPHQLIMFQLGDIFTSVIALGVAGAALVYCVTVFWNALPQVNHRTRIGIVSYGLSIVAMLVVIILSLGFEWGLLAYCVIAIGLGGAMAEAWHRRNTTGFLRYVAGTIILVLLALFCSVLLMMAGRSIAAACFVLLTAAVTLAATMINRHFDSFELELDASYENQDAKTKAGRLLQATVGPSFVVMVVAYCVVCAYCYGRANAANCDTFLVQDNDPMFVLARVYSETYIFSEYKVIGTDNAERQLTGHLRILTTQNFSNSDLVWRKVGAIDRSQ